MESPMPKTVEEERRKREEAERALAEAQKRVKELEAKFEKQSGKVDSKTMKSLTGSFKKASISNYDDVGDINSPSGIMSELSSKTTDLFSTEPVTQVRYLKYVTRSLFLNKDTKAIDLVRGFHKTGKGREELLSYIKMKASEMRAEERARSFQQAKIRPEIKTKQQIQRELEIEKEKQKFGVMPQIMKNKAERFARAKDLTEASERRTQLAAARFANKRERPESYGILNVPPETMKVRTSTLNQQQPTFSPPISQPTLSSPVQTGLLNLDLLNNNTFSGGTLPFNFSNSASPNNSAMNSGFNSNLGMSPLLGSPPGLYGSNLMSMNFINNFSSLHAQNAPSLPGFGGYGMAQSPMMNVQRPTQSTPHIDVNNLYAKHVMKVEQKEDNRQNVSHEVPESQSKAPRRWTQEEDNLLLLSVQKHGARNWKKIAEDVPGRNHVQCLQRWRKALDPSVVKGHWSPEEDEKLLALVSENPKNWGHVAKGIEGRTAKQCRERFRNHLDPNIKKGDWSLEEDVLIVKQQKELGNKWADIARALPGRTENSVKIRWKTIKRQVLAMKSEQNGSILVVDDESSSKKKKSKRNTMNQERLKTLFQLWSQISSN